MLALDACDEYDIRKDTYRIEYGMFNLDSPSFLLDGSMYLGIIRKTLCWSTGEYRRRIELGWASHCPPRGMPRPQLVVVDIR